MTQDFFLGQLRLIAVAIIAFATGKGWLSAADSSLLGAILPPVALLIGPWAWSIYSNLNRKLVPGNSVAISGEHVLGATAPGSTVYVKGDPNASTPGMVKVVGAILFAFLILAPSQSRAATVGACSLQTLFNGLSPTNFQSRLASCASSDFQAALDDANTAPIDNIAIACLQPATQVVKALEAASNGTGGVVLAFQKFRRAKQSGFVGACQAYINTTIMLQ